MNNNYVIYNNKKIYLTQDAHREVPLNAAWDFQAYGQDDDGLDYIIKWQQLPGYDGNDDSYACAWDDFTVKAL